MIFVVMMMFASIGRTADAQILDFLTTFDFDAFLVSICPILAAFGVPVPVCDTGSDDDGGSDDGGSDDGGNDDGDEPAPAPTKKGKVVTGTAAPVAPSATP